MFDKEPYIPNTNKTKEKKTNIKQKKKMNTELAKHVMIH